MYVRFLLITVLFIIFGGTGQLHAQQQINFGVLSFQPKSITKKIWRPLEKSLESQLSASISIVPMTESEIEEAIQNHHIDYLFTNPSQYIYFRNLYGLTAPLVTVIRGTAQKELHAFGGSIVALSNNTDIDTLEDLKGKKVSVPFDSALGAFQMQQYELHLQGLPPIKPDQLVITGLPHDNGLRALEKGEADVAFVRAGTLERMAEAGKIDINQFKVINHQPFSDYPVEVSTHLYPEWPLSALPHVSTKQQAKIIVALLNIQDRASEELPFNILGFQPPANYEQVEVLMRTLRVAPFDSAPDMRINDIWGKYHWELSASIVALIVIIFLSFYLYVSRKSIVKSAVSLQKSNHDLHIFQQIVSSVSELLSFVDNNYVYRSINKNYCLYHKKSADKIIGRTIAEINGDESFRAFIKAEIDRALSGEQIQYEQWFDFSGVGRRYAIVEYTPYQNEKGAITGVVVAVKDITKHKEAEIRYLELENQLRQKHKMEAVGFMAGGMAHNFNNNLSIILGNVELSQMKQAPGSDSIQLLENAKIAVRRSRDLVQKIITYSRKGMQSKVPTKLTEIIDETIALLQATLPTTINLQKKYCSDCHTKLINADPSQIQEVLINLCNNAIHAMQEKGDLTISLEPVELQAQDILAQYDCLPGHYAKFSVQDSGCGMPAEMLDKIFDPFYSTKEEYEGAGMGLSTVQGIVAQHGGMIKVNSQLNHGTTFELYFPLLELTDNAESEAEKPPLSKGTECILFVDDDERLAILGERLLSTLGYQVSMMTDSTEALKMFTANADRFDLVITDQTMPQLTGKELIAEIKKVRSDIPTILCTGYSSKIDEAEAVEFGISAFMMKPLDLPVLSQTIRQVLDGNKEK